MILIIYLRTPKLFFFLILDISNVTLISYLILAVYRLMNEKSKNRPDFGPEILPKFWV